IEALTGHAQPQEGAREVLVSDVISYVTRKVLESARKDWRQEQTPDSQTSGNFPIALIRGGKGVTAAEFFAALRTRLQRLDAVEIETLCLDHFPAVYDKFSRGMRRDEMINLLLDHCRRNPEELARLKKLLPQ
ncbi:MAG TPA: hypothetical protein P5195_07820, partial [Anaerolineae bacterium]|nr:hypothetical protein [Anaerolineae bacterium]